MHWSVSAVVAAVLLSNCITLARANAQAPLIERTRLFGNPAFLHARLSPNGKWISWTAPRNGVLNLWVAPAAEPTQARPLTAEVNRPLEHYFWSPDSSTILYLNDKGGDENFRLYGVDVATGTQRTLTAFERTRTQIVAISNRVKDRILIGVNNRDARWHDVYSLDVKSGKLDLVMENEGYSGFISDRSLALRIVSRARADGGNDFFRITGGKVEDRPFISFGLEDALSTRPLSFTDDGKTLYWVDSRGRDRTAVVAQDLATGQMNTIAEDARADIGDILVDPTLTDPATGRVQAYLVEYLRGTWVPLDTKVAEDLDFLAERLKGEISITSRTDADDAWTVEVDPVISSASTYLYVRKSRRLERLFVNRPQLQGAQLAVMHPLELRARDGLTLVSYLTLPPGSDKDGDGKPETPLPMMLLVHGGPWLRDSYGYDPYHQWLANRGYAVLSVNFRGSSGFGKRFISAGDREWAGKMQDDLIDALDWAVSSGVAAKHRVGIMGGSYGGYASLVGLTFTPDVFACAIDVVGPSNLTSLLAATPPYWESLKRQLYSRIGDPTTLAGQRLLRERSPLFRLDAIKKPLLIAQGANDPRVPRTESDQIVQAMAAKNIPVTYLLFPDEGHGLTRPENVVAFAAVAENFLASCLGGRAEPIGAAVTPSSVQVLQGEAYVPGMASATKHR